MPEKIEIRKLLELISELIITIWNDAKLICPHLAGLDQTGQHKQKCLVDQILSLKSLQRTAAWHLTLIPANWQLIPGPNLWWLTGSQTPKRAQNVQPGPTGPCLSARLQGMAVRAVAVLRGFRLQLWVKMRVWSVKSKPRAAYVDSWTVLDI